MKIEIIKETPLYGKIQYYVHINGDYVGGSLCYSVEEVNKKIEDILATFNQNPGKEIIKTTKI